jgi:hypothetical protein
VRLAIPFWNITIFVQTRLSRGMIRDLLWGFAIRATLLRPIIGS